MISTIMDIQTLLKGIITLLNSIVPFILAIALIVFLWNMVRYFIIEGANEKEHENAKSLALWGIMAFVVMLGIWGIVNLLIGEIGLSKQSPIVPDYMKTGGVGGGGTSGMDFPYAEDAPMNSDDCIGHDFSQGPC